MGAMQRSKGIRGEREVIDQMQPIVTEVFESLGMEPLVLKRNTLACDGGGSDVAGLPWLSVEVKYHTELHLNNWWKQTLAQCGSGQTPVLLYRRTGVREWRAMMYATIGGGEQAVTTVAIVPMADFLKWFRNRLSQEMLA